MELTDQQLRVMSSTGRTQDSICCAEGGLVMVITGPLGFKEWKENKMVIASGYKMVIVSG